jgi:hypothetical protein
VFCICWWSLPAQSLTGPRPLVLVTIFYCLRFETSLFVASCDSQGHGGGIRLRLQSLEFTNELPFISATRPESVMLLVVTGMYLLMLVAAETGASELFPSN